MLRVISGDAREFYEKHTEENAQVPFFIHTATDELIYGKGNAVAQFFIWAFLGFISLSVRLVFYTSVCIMT